MRAEVEQRLKLARKKETMQRDERQGNVFDVECSKKPKDEEEADRNDVAVPRESGRQKLMG